MNGPTRDDLLPISAFVSPKMLENPWAHLEAEEERRTGRRSRNANGNGGGGSVADEEGAADRPWH